MDNASALMSHSELVAELDDVEKAIVRTSAFERRLDDHGAVRISVSRELLALAEREYALVTELRSRSRQLSTAA